MPESVSATTTFNLPVDEIVQEALDTLGGDSQSGYDTTSVIRSFNLLLIDLTNRGYPLGILEKRTLNLVDGTAEYELDEDAIAVLDANLKDGDTETQMRQIPFLDYFNISNKDTEGPSSQFCFDRTGDTPKVRLYPTPNDSTLDMEYWVVRRHKDIDKLYQLADMQYRYLPALCMGLSYFMAFKRPNTDMSYVQFLKTEYQDRLDAAFGEDRDHFDMMIYPYVYQRR